MNLLPYLFPAAQGSYILMKLYDSVDCFEMSGWNMIQIWPSRKYEKQLRHFKIENCFKTNSRHIWWTLLGSLVIFLSCDATRKVILKISFPLPNLQIIKVDLQNFRITIVRKELPFIPPAATLMNHEQYWSVFPILFIIIKVWIRKF